MTQETYVHHVSMFARHFGRSPEALGSQEIRTYQVYLATEKELSPSSISVAVAALRFLYNLRRSTSIGSAKSDAHAKNPDEATGGS